LLAANDVKASPELRVSGPYSSAPAAINSWLQRHPHMASAACGYPISTDHAERRSPRWGPAARSYRDRVRRGFTCWLASKAGAGANATRDHHSARQGVRRRGPLDASL